MEQGDIIRITDVQRMAGYDRDIRNVYYYLVATMGEAVPLPLYSRDLAEAFYSTVIINMLPLQSGYLTHIQLEFFNMSFQQEEATETWDTPIPGLVEGDPLPANVSYSFKLQRYARLLRNGSKRIAGVPEAAVFAGRQLALPFVTPVADMVAALSVPIAVEGESVDALLTAQIVRVPSNPGVTPTVYTAVTEAEFRGFGTQNTRKQL